MRSRIQFMPDAATWAACSTLRSAISERFVATKRSGLAGTVYKGLFLVLGGEVPTEHRTNTENEAFDPKTNSWRTLAPMAHGSARGQCGH